MTDYELGAWDCMDGIPSRNLSNDYLNGYADQYAMEARNDTK